MNELSTSLKIKPIEQQVWERVKEIINDNTKMNELLIDTLNLLSKLIHDIDGDITDPDNYVRATKLLVDVDMFLTRGEPWKTK